MINTHPRQRVDRRDPEYRGQVRLDVAEMAAIDPVVEQRGPYGERRDEDADTQVWDGEGCEEVLVYLSQLLSTEQHEQDQDISHDDRSREQEYQHSLKRERHHKSWRTMWALYNRTWLYTLKKSGNATWARKSFNLLL